MSDCKDIRPLMHAMFDGELDAANIVRCEEHLSKCTACTYELARIKSLREQLKINPISYSAPDHLRHRVVTRLNQAVERTSGIPSGELMWRIRSWLLPLSSVALVAILVVMLSFQHLGSSNHELLLDEVVASHVRSLQENHLIDIANSSQHVIKPWFAGRLDYSPTVIDLSSQGFELVGARLDYLQHRKVAALVYRYGAHVVNVFVWPSSEADKSPRMLLKQGYNVGYWDRNGMSYWAVSDMNAMELKKFTTEFDL